MFRLQLQFFSLSCVGINCCNVMPFCRILFFRISYVIFSSPMVDIFNINFLAPTQNTQCWPPKKNDVPHFLGNDAKGTHINFFGGFWGQKPGPKRAIFGRKNFSLLLFSCPYSWRLSRDS